MAKLTFVYGAMNSGKSDTLIKTAYNYTEQNLRIITMKPAIDNKGGDKIVARAGGVWDVDLMITPATDIEAHIATEFVSQGKKVHCILVDESQFLEARHIEQLHEIAKLHNISVIAYGIRTDFTSHTFPGSKRLLELADVISKLVTMCRCGEQAEFNCRMLDGAIVFDGSQVAIDDDRSVAYTSLCGKCYFGEKIRYNKGNKESHVTSAI